MPKVLNNFLIRAAFIAPVLLSACSVFVQAVPVDVLYISNWQERRVDFNPGGSFGFVSTAQTAPNAHGKRINPAIEPVVEFTTAIGRDGSLYLAYTTKLNSSQTVTLDETAGATVSNIYTEVLETLDFTTNQEVARVFQRNTAAGVTTHTFLRAETNSSVVGKTSIDSGVWVRLLRYDSAKSAWTVEFASERPANFSGIKIAFIPGRTSPYIAAISNNNRLALFGRPSQMENIEFIGGASADLNGGRNPSSVSQLSTFNEGDRLYVAFIEDDRSVIGFVRGLQWLENYYDKFDGRTPSIFNMAATQGEIYGVWWNPTDQITAVSAFSTSGQRRWHTVNNLIAMESPKIKSRYYTEFGSPKLDIYLGYIYGATKYFQLAKVSNNQIYTTAPPVDGYNDRYDFDIDNRGRLIYSRINSGNTLDIVTWTRNLWRTAEQPQKILPEITVGSTRLPYKTSPRSAVNAIFVQGTKPHLVFVEDTGYLQLLEGISSQN